MVRTLLSREDRVAGVGLTLGLDADALLLFGLEAPRLADDSSSR